MWRSAGIATALQAPRLWADTAGLRMHASVHPKDAWDHDGGMYWWRQCWAYNNRLAKCLAAVATKAFVPSRMPAGM